MLHDQKYNVIISAVVSVLKNCILKATESYTLQVLLTHNLNEWEYIFLL